MRMRPNGVALLTQWEGCELKVYHDSAGLPTIGVGHLLVKSELTSGKITIAGVPVDYTDGITRQQAEDLLSQGLGPTEQAVNDGVKVTLHQNQFDALTSFTFNVGVPAFGRSTLLKILNQGEYAQVPGQLMMWTRAAGRVVQGLVIRRRDEIKLWNQTDADESGSQ